MSHPTSQIFSSHNIKGAVLRNRLAVAPMTRVSALDSGIPTQSMHDYYVRFAKGRFGLVFTEGLYPDKAFSQGYRFQPGLADDEQAQAWGRTTEEVQSHGTLIFAQLMHAGALSQWNRFRAHTVAPTAIRPKGEQMTFCYGEGRYAEPKEITDEEITEVIEGFVNASGRAVRIAGFNGIEIHGANGYLLDQFLTAETNRRKDRWGGSVAARVSVLVEIVKAVKAEVGKQVPVGIRISQGKVNDFTSKWVGGEEDAEVIFGSLARAGADFIHVTEFEAWKPAFVDGIDTLIELARRYAPNVSIIANGNLHISGRAESALTLGADVITVGRGALANPDMPILLAGNHNLREFDASILSPFSNIKRSELEIDMHG